MVAGDAVKPKSSALAMVAGGAKPDLAAFSQIVLTMRTIWVIFVLAVITVAGEIYADAVMTSSLLSPAAPDPAILAVGHATTG
jgi:hypothetical protein